MVIGADTILWGDDNMTGLFPYEIMFIFLNFKRHGEKCLSFFLFGEAKGARCRLGDCHRGKGLEAAKFLSAKPCCRVPLTRLCSLTFNGVICRCRLRRYRGCSVNWNRMLILLLPPNIEHLQGVGDQFRGIYCCEICFAYWHLHAGKAPFARNPERGITRGERGVVPGKERVFVSTCILLWKKADLPRENGWLWIAKNLWITLDTNFCLAILGLD